MSKIELSLNTEGSLLDFFLEKNFPDMICRRILSGGVVNNMLEISLPHTSYIVRGYPINFQEKLPYEEYVLNECARINLPTPRIVSIDSSKEFYPAPVIILEKIEGEPLERIERELTSQQIITILDEAADVLLRAACEIDIHDHIGYVHEATYKGTFTDFVAQKTKDYKNIIQYHNLIDPGLLDLSRDFVLSNLDSLSLEKPKLTYVDHNLKNILVRDGRLAGIIDWEFIMGGNPLIAYGNLTLTSCLHERLQSIVSSFINSRFADEKGSIPVAATFRALELLSYMPNTGLFNEAEKKRQITKKEKALKLIFQSNGLI